MDYAYIAGRVKALRQELEEIARHNRQYFAHKNHSEWDKARHEELKTRVYEIRYELLTLLKPGQAYSL